MPSLPAWQHLLPLFRDAPWAIAVTDARLDADGPGLVYCNEAFARLTGLGVASGAPNGRARSRRAPVHWNGLRDQLRRGQPGSGFGLSVPRLGRDVSLEWHCAPLRNSAGAIVNWVLLHRSADADRSSADRPADERAPTPGDEDTSLRATPPGSAAAAGPAIDGEALLAALPGAVVVYAETGDAVAANDAFARWYGAARAPVLAGLLPGSFPSGRPHEVLRPRPARARLADGTTAPVSIVLRRLAGASRGLWCCVLEPTDGGHHAAPSLAASGAATDEIESLQQQVQELQKLETVGLLATGIAHDFNNILLAVIGNADLALLELDGSDRIGNHLRDIIGHAQRAGELCRQVLTYAGRGKTGVERLDLNTLVRGMWHLLEISVGKRATLRHDLTPDVPTVLADATQLRQVLLNLVINAADAIGSRGGIVRVSTGARSDGSATLSVIDDGAGMDEQTRARIFEPFFTTKAGGHGLGLAAVRRIVDLHGGALRVESAPGAGTEFCMMFPAAEPDSQDARQRLPRDLAPRAGRILVVDDEKPLRVLAGLLLGQRGYDVVAAASGPEAIDLVREHGSTLDAVLLDLTMPDMDGRQTASRIRRLAPDLPIVLTSAYTADAADPDSSARDADPGTPSTSKIHAFLHKPYRARELFDAIDRAVGLRDGTQDTDRERDR